QRGRDAEPERAHDGLVERARVTKRHPRPHRAILERDHHHAVATGDPARRLEEVGVVADLTRHARVQLEIAGADADAAAEAPIAPPRLAVALSEGARSKRACRECRAGDK